MTTVAMIGLGAMGARMAHRFLAAGHDLVVWNRTAAKAATLVEAGAIPADTPAQAAVRAELTAIMVADPAALREVTSGPDGIAAGIGDATVAQMSTVEPSAIAELRDALPDSAGLLDAPVLGSLTEAESGALKVFIGGPATLVERWSPVLSVLGALMHVGDLGAGTATKLVANSTLLTTLTALGETLRLADALGVPRDVAFDVLSGTPLAAAAERRRAAVQSGEYPVRFTLDLAHKDADLIIGAGLAHGAELRLAAAARSWFAEAEQAGEGDRDYSAILDHILRSGSR